MFRVLDLSFWVLIKLVPFGTDLERNVDASDLIHLR